MQSKKRLTALCFFLAAWFVVCCANAAVIVPRNGSSGSVDLSSPGTIGGTTPAAGYFTTLHGTTGTFTSLSVASGTATIDASGNLVAASGAFGGAVSGTTGTFSGALSGASAAITGALSAGASGFAVDADGDTTVKSLTVTKVENVAGAAHYYSNHSTDTTGVGFMGPDSASGMASSYFWRFPEGEPSSGQVPVLGNIAEVTEGGITRRVAPITYQTAVMSASVPWQRDIHIQSPAATDVVRFRTVKAITLSAIGCIVDPADSSESVVVDILECNGDGDSCSTVISGTLTCGNTSTTATISDTALAANAWVEVALGTGTGTVSNLSIYLRGTEAQ